MIKVPKKLYFVFLTKPLSYCFCWTNQNTDLWYNIGLIVCNVWLFNWTTILCVCVFYVQSLRLCVSTRMKVLSWEEDDIIVGRVTSDLHSNTSAFPKLMPLPDSCIRQTLILNILKHIYTNIPFFTQTFNDIQHVLTMTLFEDVGWSFPAFSVWMLVISTA